MGRLKPEDFELVSTSLNGERYLDNTPVWNNASQKLPELNDDEDPVDCVASYHYPDNPNVDPSTECVGIVTYYGDNCWKDMGWETVEVKYWIRIPDLPE